MIDDGVLLKEIIDEYREIRDEVIKEKVQPIIDSMKKLQKEGTRKFAQEQIDKMYQEEAGV